MESAKSQHTTPCHHLSCIQTEKKPTPPPKKKAQVNLIPTFLLHAEIQTMLKAVSISNLIKDFLGTCSSFNKISIFYKQDTVLVTTQK